MDKTNDYMTIDADTAKEIEEKMPMEDELYELADLFKVFGDSTRIKILYVLYENEMCVYDIASLLNMTQSAISHQLRVLKQNRLVKYRKEGKTAITYGKESFIGALLSYPKTSTVTSFLTMPETARFLKRPRIKRK